MSGFDSTRLSLVLRLRDRTDPLSWREFHERYGELLYRYARTRGASAEDAEDVVQEVEMYLFKAMPGFTYDATKGRFRAYLRAAVVHALTRRAAKRAHAAELLDPHALDHLAAAADAESDQRWEREWRLHRLRWALRMVASEFEPATLEAFRLHVLENRPAKEAAASLSLSMASIYQAKSRVLKRVKEKLEDLDPDADV